MKQTLYFKDERSDKVYMVEIKPEGNLFHVNFAFGRRGGTLQTGCKTSAGPVERTAAEKIFQALLNEKTAKGYQPGVEAGPASTRRESPVTTTAGMTVAPLLLNAIDEAEALKLIADNDWLMQPKFDGVRVQLHKVGDDVRGYSRTKKSVSLPEDVIKAARIFPRDFVVDGELIGDLFVCFDILSDGDIDMSQRPCVLRAAAVASLWSHEGTGIVSSLSALTTNDKQAFYDTLHLQGAEGAVFKRKSAPYTSGRPNSGGDARKFKFWASASVIVAGRNGNKRAVNVKLYDGTDMGSVTIPPNRAIPATGAIIEVKYLYVHDVGGKLIQPTFLSIREDIEPSACTADQFEVKGEERS